MNDLDMVMAVSALQGFGAGQDGISVLELIRSMNLGKAEWQFIKENYDHVLTRITPQQVFAIDRYFEERES